MTEKYFKPGYVFFQLFHPFKLIVFDFLNPKSNLLEDQSGYRSAVYQMWEIGYYPETTNCKNFQVADKVEFWIQDFVGFSAVPLVLYVSVAWLVARTIRKSSVTAKATLESQRNVAIKAKQVAPSARMLVRQQLQKAQFSDDPEIRRLERALATFSFLAFTVMVPMIAIQGMHQLFLNATLGDVQKGHLSWQDCLLAHDLSAKGIESRDAHWGFSSAEAFDVCGEAPPVQPFNVWYWHYGLMFFNTSVTLTFLFYFGINERNMKLCIQCVKSLLLSRVGAG